MSVKQLDLEEFKKNVVDCERRECDWKFLGSRPAVVDFYATWCGPCQMLAPVMEDLSKEYDGKIDFYKVDTGMEKKLSYAFKIKSIPTIMFCPLQGEPQYQVGFSTKEALRAKIEQLLASGR